MTFQQWRRWAITRIAPTNPHLTLPLAALALLAILVSLVLLAFSGDLDQTLLAGGAPDLSADLPPQLCETAAALYRLEGVSHLAHRLAKQIIPPQSRGVRRWMQAHTFPVLLQITHTQEERLRHYLNRASMGSVRGVPIKGITQAAAVYFGLPCARLSVGESALLCYLARHPQSDILSAHPDDILAMRNLLLLRLRGAGALSYPDYQAESNLPLSLTVSHIPVN